MGLVGLRYRTCTRRSSTPDTLGVTLKIMLDI